MALKKMKLRGLKFGDLEKVQVILDPSPGELTLPFGDSRQEESQDTNLDMGFNPPWQPVIHRCQLDLGGLECAKTPFDNQETFIAGGGVFQGNGVIVGDQHPFAIIPGSLLHGLAVEPNTVRVLVDFQITLIAAGGQQIDGPAGRGFGLDRDSRGGKDAWRARY